MKALLLSLVAVVMISGGAVIGGRIGLDSLKHQVRENQVKRTGTQNAELQILLAQL